LIIVIIQFVKNNVLRSIFILRIKRKLKNATKLNIIIDSQQ